MIEGSLRNVPLADVFQIVVTSQKSGILTVAHNDSQARIFFEKGRIQSAHLDPGVHLGEIMVRLDLLSTLEVQQLLAVQGDDSDGTPLGQLGVDRTLIDQDDLLRAVERQVFEVVSELLSWRDGTFNFAEQSEWTGLAISDHNIDAMTILMDVAEQLSESEDGSADPGAVFQRAGDPTKVTMPAGAWEVLANIDGKRSARSIAAEMDLRERKVYRLLYQLQTLGIVEASPFEVEDPLVLVVSQSRALRQLLQLSPQRARFRTHVVTIAGEALSFLADNYPSAVVVDDHQGEGWAFVKAFRQLPGKGHLPVLVLTEESSGFRGLLGRRRRPKASTLEKPFQELDLQERITGLVGRSVA